MADDSNSNKNNQTTLAAAANAPSCNFSSLDSLPKNSFDFAPYSLNTTSSYICIISPPSNVCFPLPRKIVDRAFLSREHSKTRRDQFANFVLRFSSFSVFFSLLLFLCFYSLERQGGEHVCLIDFPISLLYFPFVCFPSLFVCCFSSV